MTTGLLILVMMLSGVAAAATADRRVVDAAEQRDLDAVRALVKRRVDVNVPQPDGATALHWAAHYDDLDAARVLIGARAHVDAVNDYGVTPLSLAAMNGSAGMIALLLQAGANPNLAPPTGETPLMTAARVGRTEPAAVLVDKGADVNARESAKGQTALMWALSEHHLEMARYLIDHGADIQARSNTGMTAVLFAARQGDIDAMRLVLSHGARIEDANADGVTPLLFATVRGHSGLVEFLLERGADPNANGPGFTALHWAAGKWETSMTHDYPDAEGEWKALGGLRDRKVDVVKTLIAHGADVNARATKNPPRFGVNMFAVVKMAGVTPFWIAAMSADVGMMKLLADYGANPSLVSNEDVTPLMMASGMARVEGDSLVTETESIEAARLCLEMGNDINAVSAAGDTALHGAAWFGLDNVARFLVERGADMSVKNKKGQTPLELAEGNVFNSLLRMHPTTAKVLRELAAARAKDITR